MGSEEMERKWGHVSFPGKRREDSVMDRVRRVDVGERVYHGLNRANLCSPLFNKAGPYEDFLGIVEESLNFVPMHILVCHPKKQAVGFGAMGVSGGCAIRIAKHPVQPRAPSKRYLTPFPLTPFPPDTVPASTTHLVAQTYAFLAFVCGSSCIHGVSSLDTKTTVDVSTLRTAEEARRWLPPRYPLFAIGY